MGSFLLRLIQLCVYVWVYMHLSLVSDQNKTKTIFQLVKTACITHVHC